MVVTAHPSVAAAVQAFIREWNNAEPFIVAHTSGSTGRPKAIKLQKSDMLASAGTTVSFFGLNARSTLFCPLSIDYIAAKMMAVRAFVAGCRVIFTPPSLNPLAFMPLPRCVNLLPIVPPQIPRLLGSQAARRIRHVIVGGSAITDADEALLANAPTACYATYGMTETCSHIALRRVGEPAFHPLPGFSVACEPDGRLAIASSQMSFGRLITNDLAHVNADGSFRILGRADNVIVSGAEKIVVEELERAIATFFPSPFFIVGRPSRRWGSEVVMVTEPNPLTSAQILELCRSHLPRHRVPKEVIITPQIRRSDRGKIIRKLP